MYDCCWISFTFYDRCGWKKIWYFYVSGSTTDVTESWKTVRNPTLSWLVQKKRYVLKTNSVRSPDVSRSRPSRLPPFFYRRHGDRDKCRNYGTWLTVAATVMGGGRRRARSSEQVARRRERVPVGGEWKNRRRRAQFSYSRRAASSTHRLQSHRPCFVRVISDRLFRRRSRPTSLLVRSRWKRFSLPASSARVFRCRNRLFRVVRFPVENGKP